MPISLRFLASCVLTVTCVSTSLYVVFRSTRSLKAVSRLEAQQFEIKFPLEATLKIVSIAVNSSSHESQSLVALWPDAPACKKAPLELQAALSLTTLNFLINKELQ